MPLRASDPLTAHRLMAQRPDDGRRHDRESAELTVPFPLTVSPARLV
jgi:hypothetical protein